MKLFVDDERPAPEGWVLAASANDAIVEMAFAELHNERIDKISLDHDLGYSDTIMPALIWMRDKNFWPLELYVHTANEDGQEAMLAFIDANAPSDVLRGFGCNFWGTGPDSVEQTWRVPR